MEFINDPNYYDQHFLINENVIEKFIEISNLNKDDIIVEVGPGQGILTKKIAPKVKKVYCIELDTRLKTFLDEICNEYKNIEIIYNNVLNTFIPKCTKIITALPYSIVEPFMNKMLKCEFDELIMITGKRFAEKVMKKEINRLSLMVNCFFEFEKIMDITPDNFSPRPRVLSSMIKLKPKKNLTDFNDMIFKRLFLMKNKKIKNGLVECLIINKYCNTQKEAKSIVAELNLSEDLLETKFEVCSNTDLANLYNEVNKLSKRRTN